MAKDYFQDILPPSEEPASDRPHEIPIRVEDDAPVRGIRSIQPPTRLRPPARSIPNTQGRIGADVREQSPEPDRPPARSSSRWWIWVAAALSLLVIGSLSLLAFRSTTVSVTPKSRQLALTGSGAFVALPASAALGSSRLSYTLQTSDIEDSEVIPSQGTRHVESKASGSITVYNEYSASSVRLIKNTRFETPEGLIFRAPADVVVPGKSGSAPGQIKIAVVADQPGEKYNVGPVARFTLPGLKSGDMYAKVFATSAAAMAGGFVGDEPGTAPGALNSAIAAIRSRLESTARETALAQAGSEDVVFPELLQISYQSQPNTIEAGSGVRIHEKAHIDIPVFPKDAFASTIAQSAAADADTSAVMLIPGAGFSAQTVASASTTYGADPIVFTLSGQALLVWKVDINALAAALAGRDRGAFQTIVDGFPGIQEAHARIEPPWKKTFPANPASIKINVQTLESK